MDSFIKSVLCLLIILLIWDNQVAAQEGPVIVIAHPGQDIELLCTVTVTSGDQTAAWLINNTMGPYRINAIRGGILAGYTATLGSHNLIVEDIMMNDDRNGSDYRCVIVPAVGLVTFADIIEESDPTILYVTATGVPALVPNVIVDNNTININGNNVTLTLRWGEPFNNLDPIVNYTVSCSGDVTCPPNFTTTDNTTRSYTITNLTPMTSYTFSVVATNSIGSGEAGVVMITTPNIFVITTSSVGMTTMPSMSTIVNVTNTTSIQTATITTSNITTSNTTTATATITIATTLNMDMTTSKNGVLTTSTIATITTTTATTATTAVDNNASSNTGNDDGGGSTVIIVVIVIIILLVTYCCLILLFFYCYYRKEKNYQNKDDHHDRIIHASILVLGILTCGTSFLLWWLWRHLAKLCCDNHSGEERLSNEYDEVPDNSVRNSVAYTASPQIPAKEKDTIATTSNTAPADAKEQELHYDYAATGISLIVAGTKDKKKISTPQQPTEAVKQSSVPHMTTSSGARYALSDKASVKGSHTVDNKTEDQGIKYADLHHMSDYVNVNREDSNTVPYAEVL